MLISEIDQLWMALEELDRRIERYNERLTGAIANFNNQVSLIHEERLQMLKETKNGNS